jgi:signal transduction histidine kinase
VEQALELVAFGGKNESVEIAYFMDDSVPSVVFTDPVRLRQVCFRSFSGLGDLVAHPPAFQIITNVVTNGVKFSPNGGCVTVRVAGKRLSLPQRGMGGCPVVGVRTHGIDGGGCPVIHSAGAAAATAELPDCPDIPLSNMYVIQFEVVDTGIGIARDRLPTLFRAFGQSDSRFGSIVILSFFILNSCWQHHALVWRQWTGACDLPVADRDDGRRHHD